MAYDLGAFYGIVGVHFGTGAYLVVNVDASAGVQGSSTPPPFGSFSFKLDKGTTQISQQTLSKTTSSNPGGPKLLPIYFVWDGALTLPDAVTYNININALNGDVPLPLPVSPNSGFFVYCNQFSVEYQIPGGTILSPTGGNIPGTFANLSQALTAASQIETVQTLEAVRMYTDDGDDTFIPPPHSFFGTSITVPIDQMPSASSGLNNYYIFQIPTGSTIDTLMVTLVSFGVTQGWCSVFTKQKNTIKSRSDLTGKADMSVYLPNGFTSGSLAITTTGVAGKGTVSVPGGVATAPLAPTAPFAPPSS